MKLLAHLLLLALLWSLDGCGVGIPDPSKLASIVKEHDPRAPHLTLLSFQSADDNAQIPSPTFTLNATKAGRLLYERGCEGDQKRIEAGTATISFLALASGRYDYCTVTLIDRAGHYSHTIRLPAFTVHSEQPVERYDTFEQERGVTRMATLDKKLHESSGIALVQGRLFTHNDSGGDAALYEIDRHGRILRRIEIEGATNVDWEDLAQDGTYLYIADIGNNDGTRTDLKIYRIDKEALLHHDRIAADTITFSYPDRSDLSSHPYATAYDAEALFATETGLTLMTKNWIDATTQLFTLPKRPGDYTAQLTAGRTLPFLVTSAAYDSARDLLAVTGYEGLTATHPHIVLFRDFSREGLSKMHACTPKELPLGFRQIEGVAFDAQGALWITSERYDHPPLDYAPASLFHLLPE